MNRTEITKLPKRPATPTETFIQGVVKRIHGLAVSDHCIPVPKDAKSVYVMKRGPMQVTMYLRTNYGLRVQRDGERNSVNGIVLTLIGTDFNAHMVHALSPNNMMMQGGTFQGSGADVLVYNTPNADIQAVKQGIESFVSTCTRGYSTQLSVAECMDFVCIVDERKFEFCCGPLETIANWNQDLAMARIMSFIQSRTENPMYHVWTYEGMRDGRYQTRPMLGMLGSDMDSLLECGSRENAEYVAPAYKTRAVGELTPDQHAAIAKHVEAWGDYLDHFWITGGTVVNAITGNDLAGSNIDVIAKDHRMRISELVKLCPDPNVYIFHTPTSTVLVPHVGGVNPTLRGVPALQIIHMNPQKYTEETDFTPCAFFVDRKSNEIRTHLAIAAATKGRVLTYAIDRFSDSDREQWVFERAAAMGSLGWDYGTMADVVQFEHLLRRDVAVGGATFRNIMTPVTCFSQLENFPLRPCFVSDIVPAITPMYEQRVLAEDVMINPARSVLLAQDSRDMEYAWAIQEMNRDLCKGLFGRVKEAKLMVNAVYSGEVFSHLGETMTEVDSVLTDKIVKGLTACGVADVKCGDDHVITMTYPDVSDVKLKVSEGVAYTSFKHLGESFGCAIDLTEDDTSDNIAAHLKTLEGTIRRTVSARVASAALSKESVV